MAATVQRSLTIKTTNSTGKTQNINLSNVNPDSSDTDMKTVVNALKELTTNDYEQTIVNDRYVLDLT